jgi:hypothetical protein
MGLRLEQWLEDAEAAQVTPRPDIATRLANMPVEEAREALQYIRDIREELHVILPEWFTLATNNQKDDQERQVLSNEYERYKKLFFDGPL